MLQRDPFVKQKPLFDYFVSLQIAGLSASMRTALRLCKSISLSLFFYIMWKCVPFVADLLVAASVLTTCLLTWVNLVMYSFNDLLFVCSYGYCLCMYER